MYISENEHGHEVNRGAVRVGAAYAIEAGSFSITPQLNFEFMSEKTYTVYGIGFGYGF